MLGLADKKHEKNPPAELAVKLPHRKQKYTKKYGRMTHEVVEKPREANKAGNIYNPAEPEVIFVNRIRGINKVARRSINTFIKLNKVTRTCCASPTRAKFVPCNLFGPYLVATVPPAEIGTVQANHKTQSLLVFLVQANQVMLLVYTPEPAVSHQEHHTSSDAAPAGSRQAVQIVDCYAVRCCSCCSSLSEVRSRMSKPRTHDWTPFLAAPGHNPDDNRF
ncbi:60S ribosomal protein L7 [Culex quinquefasciatus]|uniref:60S ribosomal protein L7 n=1 Tax=Culex quinquefasciatus TaxID=7176 RepID=B0WTY2_CULQU|nr:60S ribosomal protein L7 [Culex quinquefasciatus]|eukprot:XP_001856785.1 60S ribosomal protein L7 [Culex quinquefasciatus]